MEMELTALLGIGAPRQMLTAIKSKASPIGAVPGADVHLIQFLPHLCLSSFSDDSSVSQDIS